MGKKKNKITKKSTNNKPKKIPITTNKKEKKKSKKLKNIPKDKNIIPKEKEEININENIIKENEIIQKDTLRTVLSKNGAIVDPYIENPSDYQVLPAKPSNYHNPFYSCTLNYSNLKNNNNKFYIIQLLKNERNGLYYIFLRWGRVGNKGQTNIFYFQEENEAINFYLEKYNSKIQYGYIEIKLNFSEDPKIKKDNILTKDNLSEFDNTVKNLIQHLFDINLFNEQMKEIGYDSTRMPLGRLSKESLDEGMILLKQIENIINQKDKGNLKELSSKFYTIIPHNFGFKHMSYFIINDLDIVKEKIEMIESLKGIDVITRTLDNNNNTQEKGNDVLLRYYNSLNCNIIPIEKDTEIYNIINVYLKNGLEIPSSPKISLVDLFLIDKEDMYNCFLGNKILLWYGTRIGNYVSILSEGFKLPSIDAPITSYIFGKGIYFSDMSVKAIYSCHPSNKIGYLLLCEIYLGKVEERVNGDYNLPKTLKEGANSVKVCGMNIPNQKEEFIDKDGVRIPFGKPIKSDIKVNIKIIYFIRVFLVSINILFMI